MKQEVLIGQTDFTVLVKIRTDAGAPATGLDEGDIDIAYARVETDNDVTTADVTPQALSALTDAHTDWGFEEVSASDHPGVYRLDIADAVFASGAWSAVVSITGTGLDPADLEFVLIAANMRDGVRLGLTALPNAAAEAAGGLYTRGSGAGQITQDANGRVNANVVAYGGSAGTFSSGRPEVNTTHIAGNSAAASALDRSARTIVRFTVGSGSTETNIVTSSMDPAAAVEDQFEGRVVVFDRDTTSANLRGQGSDITACTDDGELTVTALTNAPVSGDTGVIL